MTRRLFTAFGLSAMIAVSAGFPAAAQPDPRPGIGDFLDPNRSGGLFANIGIAGLRAVTELEYQHLSTDVLRGQIALSGVTLRPALAYDRTRLCSVEIDRLVLQSDPNLEVFDTSAITATLIGTRADMFCLPPDVQVPLRGAGYSAIELARAQVSLRYDLPTGETVVDVSAASADFATIDLSAAGTLVPAVDSRGNISDPAFRVSRAVLSLQDTGGWERISQMIPENLREPNAVRALGTSAITDALTEGGARPLTGIERNFVDDLMGHVADFIVEPGEITLQADLPPEGIIVAAESFEKPQALIAGLALDVRSAPLARSQLVSQALLARLDSGDLSDEERLELSRALLSGQGVPRAAFLAPDLLAPLVEQGNGEAALLAATALMEAGDSDQAYALALQAGAAGTGRAVALLDRLEARLSSIDVLAAQASFSASLGLADAPLDGLAPGNDPRALRARAIAHLTGIDAPRDYALAYYNALLAEAAGDIAGPILIDEINTRFLNRGDAVAEAWAATRAETERAALSDWIAGGLSERYRAE